MPKLFYTDYSTSTVWFLFHINLTISAVRECIMGMFIGKCTCANVSLSKMKETQTKNHPSKPTEVEKFLHLLQLIYQKYYTKVN